MELHIFLNNNIMVFVEFKRTGLIKKLSQKEIDDAIAKKKVFVLTLVNKNQTQTIRDIEFPIVYYVAYKWSKSRNGFKCIYYKSDASKDIFGLQEGMTEERINKIIDSDQYYIYLQLVKDCVKNSGRRPCWKNNTVLVSKKRETKQ